MTKGLFKESQKSLAPANTITVTGMGDSATITPLSGGSGTYTVVDLRSAVVDAEGLTGSDQIVFASSLFASGPQTIELTGAAQQSQRTGRGIIYSAFRRRSRPARASPCGAAPPASAKRR
jgi:hypothetical protein